MFPACGLFVLTIAAVFEPDAPVPAAAPGGLTPGAALAAAGAPTDAIVSSELSAFH